MLYVNFANLKAQCPSGWQSFPTQGFAVGLQASNIGGDVIDPGKSMGAIQLADGEFGLFRPDNAGILDITGEYIIHNLGELVTPGSPVTMSLGYFSNTASRMKIEYSTDLNTWTELGFYSRNTSSDVFYSTLGSRVAHHFTFNAPAGGFRYLRYTNVSSEAATMQANGNSQLTVDLGLTLNSENHIIISYTGKDANFRRLMVSTSTDGITYNLLGSIGTFGYWTNNLQSALYPITPLLNGDASYTYYVLPVPSGGAKFVQITEEGTGSGTQAYIDGIGYGCGFFDFGDAPDLSEGTGLGNYRTTKSDNGPMHVLRFPLWQTDKTPSLYLNAAPVRTPEAASSPKASADENEEIVLSSALTWPNLPEINCASCFVRMRLTTTPLSDVQATTQIDERSVGLAGDGEVEDYLLGVTNFSITDVSVGACKNDSETQNVPKVLVAVLLDWNDIPVGDKIAVQLGNEVKYVEASVPGTPRYAQFIVDPTGSAVDITAYLVSNPTRVKSFSATLPPPCPLPLCGGPESIGGQAFIDYNASGFSEGAEPGLVDIPVRVVDDAGTVLCSTTTGINGLWSCNGLPAGVKVRVEYLVPDGFFNSPPGQGTLTSTQFGQIGGGCSYNLGVYKPEDYVDNNPWVVTTCFGKGDPLIPGSDASSDPSIVANRFTTNGGIGTKNYYLAKGSETGTVWGVAYQPETKTVISSAFIRRHAGLGPAGLGAIYKTNAAPLISAVNPTAGSSYFGGTEVLLNLDDYGINTGDETTINRSDLGADALTPTRDADAFAKVGKWGLGDIDISARYDTLWAINLYNRTLVQIIIGNPILSPVPAGNVSEI
ncbi:MAG: hypothetical protein LW630_13010, partial [Saprospiraceae bacterium]|nr:hypothetical protein [Saprospiraceae bacterium]